MVGYWLLRGCHVRSAAECRARLGSRAVCVLIMLTPLRSPAAGSAAGAWRGAGRCGVGVLPAKSKVQSYRTEERMPLSYMYTDTVQV